MWPEHMCGTWSALLHPTTVHLRRTSLGGTTAQRRHAGGNELHTIVDSALRMEILSTLMTPVWSVASRASKKLSDKTLSRVSKMFASSTTSSDMSCAQPADGCQRMIS